MLGKILKYDLKNISREIVPLYILLTAISIFTWLCAVLRPHIMVAKRGMYILINGMRVSLIVGILGIGVFGVVIIVQYYRSNFFKDQGYLLNTIPVSYPVLIGSKLIAAFVWLSAWFMLSYLLISISWNNFFWTSKYYNGIVKVMGKEKGKIFCILVIIYLIFNLLYYLSGIFMAMNLGYSKQGMERKIDMVVITILVCIFGRIPEFIITCQNEMDISVYPISQLIRVIAISVVIFLVMIIIFYGISVRYMEKKLNLD